MNNSVNVIMTHRYGHNLKFYPPQKRRLLTRAHLFKRRKATAQNPMNWNSKGNLWRIQRRFSRMRKLKTVLLIKIYVIVTWNHSFRSTHTCLVLVLKNLLLRGSSEFQDSKHVSRWPTRTNRIGGNSGIARARGPGKLRREDTTSWGGLLYDWNSENRLSFGDQSPTSPAHRARPGAPWHWHNPRAIQ